MTSSDAGKKIQHIPYRQPPARKPPGPRMWWPWAVLQGMRNFLPLLEVMATQYGDIAYLDAGNLSFYLVNHPDLIRDILVTQQHQFMKSRATQMSKLVLGEGLLTSEGEVHRRQRRCLQPAFRAQCLQGYATTITGCADRVRQGWRAGQTVDIHHEMMELTLAIVAQAVLSADVDGEAGAIREAVNVVISMFDYAMVPGAEFLVNVPVPMNRRFRQARQRLRDTVAHIIEQHRGVEQHRCAGQHRGQTGHPDLVSMLLAGQGEGEAGNGMTDEQIRDEVITIFLAGQETMSGALSFTWYLLARHPDVEAQLHAEIDAALGGRLPTWEDLPRLPYAEAVLAESMRLYPPAYALGRCAKTDYQLGEYRVPAGSTILMSQWVMHRDQRYYADPSRFDPGRWTIEPQPARPKFAYFPFGGGARVCIGESLAWMEGVLLLTTFAQQWQPRLTTQAPLKLQPLITLRPKGGIKMRLEARPPA